MTQPTCSYTLLLQTLPRVLPLGYIIANHLRVDHVNAVYKFWLPDGFTAWYVAESDGHGTYFGVVSQNGQTELRHFTRAELDATHGVFGLAVELDLNYEPQTVQALLDGTVW